jgi:hypothetical protein
MKLDPMKLSLVTPQYIIQFIFSDDNYTCVEYIATARGEIQRQRNSRYVEHRASHVDQARDRYLCGVTHRRMLEHALSGGDEALSDPTTNEGKRFSKLYCVLWPLFVDLSK